MSNRINNVEDVVRWRMCIGCGACKAVCPKKRISLVDFVAEGIRPAENGTACDACGRCLSVCPGIALDNDTGDTGSRKELRSGWGTVLELYEGHATDPELRFNGSSGGVANALALFCIEQLGMTGVNHVRAVKESPWTNETTYSTKRDQILEACGSRYSPASPAEGITGILERNGKSVFVGKPCDVAAYYKAVNVMPELEEKTGCTIGIFCAGTPSTKGTTDLLKKMGVDRETLEEFRYRGRGWPGMAAVREKGAPDFTEKMTYLESWGFIQKYRPLRCYQCPDGTSEFADIACGDPWHQKANPGEPGISLVLVRTRRGKDIVDAAIREGYLKLAPTSAESLVVAQKNLLSKRSWIWGRLFTTRLLGIPVPVFRGFSLCKLWIMSPMSEKVRSVYGTFRRALQRNYRKPATFDVPLQEKD